jgi:hypothetical protein
LLSFGTATGELALRSLGACSTADSRNTVLHDAGTNGGVDTGLPLGLLACGRRRSSAWSGDKPEERRSTPRSPCEWVS